MFDMFVVGFAQILTVKCILLITMGLSSASFSVPFPG
jgi:hypothetical protein